MKNTITHNHFMPGIMLAVFTMLLAACNNDATDKADTPVEITDTLTAEKSIAFEDSALIYEYKADTLLKNNVTAASLKWSNFSLSAFWYEDSLPTIAYTAHNNFYKQYQLLLQWSPDSSYILDKGSLNAVLLRGKNGATIIADGDIDTEVSLLNPATKQKARLLYLGSAATLINSCWLNANQVALISTNAEKVNTADTVLWIIDVKNLYYRKYKWHQ